MPEDYSIGYMWDPQNGVYVNVAQPYVGVPSEPVKGRKMTREEKRTQKMLDEATEAFMRQADGSSVSGYPREAPLVEEHPLGALLVGRGFGKLLQGVAPQVAGYMKETAPLWKQAAKRMAIDLPAFEAIDRLPQAWGDERLTQQGTNIIKQTTPIGKYAPWAVDVAGPFIAGMVPGMLGDMAVRGTAAGVNGIMNGVARRAAADRMGYLGPMAEVMGESSARTSTRLGGESQNHIQTLLENGEFNPMDLEVGPAGSGRSGAAPANLVRNADGSVMRTPDGYVIRRGRDFTVDPNNPREFFYDNAGRQYGSIAEATGSGRSIEAPEWTAEELTNFAADARNGLSSEEQQALRDLIQQRVNETLDRMGSSRRRVSSDPDYDELAAGASSLAEYVDPDSGLVRYETIGNDSYILPDPPAEINIDLNSLTNSAPSGSQASRIVELYEPVTGDAFNMDYPTLVREPRYLDDQPNYILREILDELRDPAIAPELGINSEEAGNLELAVSHRLVRNGEGAYEQLRHAIQNVDEGELRDFINLLDNRNLSELESRYGWDLDALDSDGTSRLDNAIDELTRNARRRLRALSNNRITPPLSSGTTTAPSGTLNTREAWDNFYRATEAGNVDDAIESYLTAEGITDRSEQSKRDAIKNILRRSDLPDAMRNSFVDWFEKEASGLSAKEVLEKYLEDVQNMMSIKVVDVHGDPAWSESSFLDDHRRGFSDEAYQRAKDKLENILEGVPVSERRAFRLSKEQFDDVYSEFEPLRFSQTENKVRSARAAGYARYLNKQSNNPGIDFSKFNTPEEFASEVQHGLRESGLVDARTHLPLDISGLSYRSMEDPRAEWLINKVYDSFRDPSKPYRGVMMDPYLSRSADSHRMAYMFSARNYGKHPGGVTWNLADWPAGSNQLERNSVYIDASGKPVFTNQRVARLARRAGLDKAFSPEELNLLEEIASRRSAAFDQPAYLRAKELAQFVQDYSTNSLRDPVEQILLLDPSLNSTLMRVEPKTVESQASWLSTMLNPTHGQYISGLEGFKADFKHLPPAGILRHKHGGLIERLQKHYGSSDKILEVLNKFEGGGPAMSYVPSEEIKNYIKGTEAFRSGWYNDGNGIPTVGYGFTGRKVRELYPKGMTRAQADAYFDELVTKFAARMASLTPNIDRLTQNQKDALFSYFYNIGEGNYTKGSPKMQQALRDMDLDTVALNIDAGYNDKKNPGLKKRRDYERALFQSDIQRPVQPMLPVMNNTNHGYIYNPPVEKQKPMAIIPYKTGAWSVANPFVYAPEHEYFLDNGFFGDYRNGGNLFWPGGRILDFAKNVVRSVVDPEAHRAESYSSKKYSFDEAYKDARSKGQRTFFWDGKYYNTDYEGSHGKQYREDVASGKAAAFNEAYPGFTNPELRKEKQEELDTYGITNEQTQNKNIVSQRLLDNIDPFGDYNLTQAIDAVVLNHKQRKTDAITQANNETHIAQLRNYLGYPAEPVEFVTPKGAPAKISKYTPTVGNSQEGKYYYTFKRNPFGHQPQNPERYLNEYKRLKSVGDKYLSGQFYEDALKHGLDYATKIADENMQAWSDYYDNHRDEIKGYGPLEPAFKITQETGSKEQRRSYGNAGGLGYFAVYNNPTYSSFYDLWDIGIGQGNNTNTFGVGKPFEYYDRRYHNPAEEPDIDKLYAEFSSGGKIHIKPENRGNLFYKGGFSQMVNPEVVRLAIKKVTGKIKEPIIRAIPEDVLIRAANSLQWRDNRKHPFKIALDALDSGSPAIVDSPGSVHLLDTKRQQEKLEDAGYKLVKDDDYGPVHSAVKETSKRIGRDVPIYQIGEDEVNPSRVSPITTRSGKSYVMDTEGSIPSLLRNAGSYPTSFYKDNQTGEIYFRSYDLNDYGESWPSGKSHPYVEKDENGTLRVYDDSPTTYGLLQPLVNLYDFIGNPVVQRTGLIKASDEIVRQYFDDEYKNGGKIHIKPENRGKFTALKKRTGHSASWFKAHGTPAQKKMATFALNARKWKHGDGGVIERYGADRVLAAIQKLKG